jgi:glutamate/aspartate transport system ATP-binding protein
VSKWYGTVQVLNNCSTDIKKKAKWWWCVSVRSGKIHADQNHQRRAIPERPDFVDGQAVHDPKTDLPKLRSRVRHGVPELRVVPAPERDRKPAGANEGALGLKPKPTA